MKALKRKSASIPNPRWLAYATAGVASAFAAANSAEAAIHYSGRIGTKFGSGDDKSVRFPLDQQGDSIQLRHNLRFCCFSSYGGAAYFGVVGRAGNSLAGFYRTCGSVRIESVSKLKYGGFVSRRPFLAKNSGIMGSFGIGECDSAGRFKPGDIGFVAFKFNNGSGDQYGWARVKFYSRPFPINRDFSLLDYAYADPGEPIRAGQTSSDDMGTDKGSLGWLALGAIGLLAWRKTRPQTAH
jgi:hypothetical protein